MYPLLVRAEQRKQINHRGHRGHRGHGGFLLTAELLKGWRKSRKSRKRRKGDRFIMRRGSFKLLAFSNCKGNCNCKRVNHRGHRGHRGFLVTAKKNWGQTPIKCCT
jgi:hypothetical protein